MDEGTSNMLLLTPMASLAYNKSSTRKFAHHQKLHSQASSENQFYPRKYILASPAQPKHMRTSLSSWIATNLRGHSDSRCASTSGDDSSGPAAHVLGQGSEATASETPTLERKYMCEKYTRSFFREKGLMLINSRNWKMCTVVGLRPMAYS